MPDRQNERTVNSNYITYQDKLTGNRVIIHDRSHIPGISVDRFDSKYYSGINVDMFFNDHYIDEAVNIQYQLTNNALPLYAYHSYEFNHVAQGTRIVQGSFTINYREPMYVVKLLNRLSTAVDITPQSDQELKKQKTVSPGVTLGKRTEINHQDLFNSLRSQGGGFNKEKFQAAKNTNESLYYGAIVEKEEILNLDENIPLFQGPSTGLDIRISYGDPDRTMTSIARADSKHRVDSSDLTEDNYEILKDVFITGLGKVITDGGQPIMETYHFLCKRVEGRINIYNR